MAGFISHSQQIPLKDRIQGWVTRARVEGGTGMEMTSLERDAHVGQHAGKIWGNTVREQKSWGRSLYMNRTGGNMQRSTRNWSRQTAWTSKRQTSIRVAPRGPVQRPRRVEKSAAFMQDSWRGSRFRWAPEHSPHLHGFAPAPLGYAHLLPPYLLTDSRKVQVLFKVPYSENLPDDCSLHWSLPFWTNSFSN